MCGFAGILRFDGRDVDERELVAMRDTMYHRGPDDAGVYINGPVGLGHRRLSIVDLTAAGHQPMTNEDGSIWITFNGEVYNYVELRAELVARGHTFSSHTDTECIIHLYEEMGERCVERLGGMFAFVLWDSKRKRMFGARDRVGIKPFHYYADTKQFVCASEAKALLATPGVPRKADYLGIADFLFSGFPQSTRTLFDGVQQLPPGHSIMVDGTGVHLRKFWDVEYKYDATRSEAALQQQVHELLNDAVRIHCRSDAKLGCHLSGGLDSSTVTGFAARHRESMKTFSIRFAEGGWFDETVYARAEAEHVGAEYLEAVPDGNDLATVIPGLLWHMEMPLPTHGGFAYYTVSRLAAKHVKVTLTGHGGDEVFGGYPAQFQTAFGIRPFAEDAPQENSSHSRITRLIQFGRRLRGLGVRGIAKRMRNRVAPQVPPDEEIWMALHCGRVPAENRLISGSFVSALNGYSPVDDYMRAFRQAPTSELFDRCLYHDLRSYLPGLLYMEDRVSMSVSVESRVPLLDHRLVELMATIPPMQKVPRMEPKALLRAAARDAIPAVIRDRRDKRGFPVPFEQWTRDVLKPLSRKVLLSPDCLDRGVLDADRLRREDLSTQEIWRALNIELWFRVFIDNDPIANRPSLERTGDAVTPGTRPTQAGPLLPAR